jgi:hypothetical protein
MVAACLWERLGRALGLRGYLSVIKIIVCCAQVGTVVQNDI